MPVRRVLINPELFRAVCRIRNLERQGDLEARSGVDQSTISRMRRLPGPYEARSVRAVAAALGIADLRHLGVPDEDAAALEAEERFVAQVARTLKKAARKGSVKSARHNRAAVQVYATAGAPA